MADALRQASGVLSEFVHGKVFCNLVSSVDSFRYQYMHMYKHSLQNWRSDIFKNDYWYLLVFTGAMQREASVTWQRSLSPSRSMSAFSLAERMDIYPSRSICRSVLAYGPHQSVDFSDVLTVLLKVEDDNIVEVSMHRSFHNRYYIRQIY